jgi:hypothetical protein
MHGRDKLERDESHPPVRRARRALRVRDLTSRVGRLPIVHHCTSRGTPERRGIGIEERTCMQLALFLSPRRTLQVVCSCTEPGDSMVVHEHNNNGFVLSMVRFCHHSLLTTGKG